MYLYKMPKLEAPPVLGEFRSTPCPPLSADGAQGKSWHRKPSGNYGADVGIGNLG